MRRMLIGGTGTVGSLLAGLRQSWSRRCRRSRELPYAALRSGQSITLPRLRVQKLLSLWAAKKRGLLGNRTSGIRDPNKTATGGVQIAVSDVGWLPDRDRHSRCGTWGIQL